MGFGVWNLGFRVQGSGFRFEGLGFRVPSLIAPEADEERDRVGVPARRRAVQGRIALGFSVKCLKVSSV